MISLPSQTTNSRSPLSGSPGFNCRVFEHLKHFPSIRKLMWPQPGVRCHACSCAPRGPALVNLLLQLLQPPTFRSPWTPSGSRRSSRTSRRRRRPPSPRTTRTSRSQNHSSTLDSCAGILKVLNLTFIGLKGSIPSYCLVEINTCAPPILSLCLTWSWVCE